MLRIRQRGWSIWKPRKNRQKGWRRPGNDEEEDDDDGPQKSYGYNLVGEKAKYHICIFLVLSTMPACGSP